MTALIFKYNLTDQQWCDNRTVEEVITELQLLYDAISETENALRERQRYTLYVSLLRGDRYLNPDETVVYALSKSAIEENI